MNLVVPISPELKFLLSTSLTSVTSIYDYMLIDNELKFSNYISEKFPSHQQIYTDGSKCHSPDSVAGALYSATARQVHCWKLRSEHSVLGSELFAINKALLYTYFRKIETYPNYNFH